jgi:hypothetical protein
VGLGGEVVVRQRAGVGTIVDSGRH